MSASDLVEPLHQLEQRFRRQLIAGVHDADELTGRDPESLGVCRRRWRS